jgi:hypothetical protein
VKCGEEYKIIMKTMEDFKNLNKDLQIERPFDNCRGEELETYLNV